jgi:hypothetical protein
VNKKTTAEKQALGTLRKHRVTQPRPLGLIESDIDDDLYLVSVCRATIHDTAQMLKQSPSLPLIATVVKATAVKRTALRRLAFLHEEWSAATAQKETDSQFADFDS